MLKSVAQLIIVLTACGPGAPAAQKGSPPSPPSRPGHALTAEEKELLKQRELLENLELLQNFEKIRYFEFLAAHKADKSKAKPADKLTARDSERRNVKP